uniref:Sugar phosphate transporter domain-containing protein n=2 Tax=Ditylum brightwellii TaxID=49249 RepID=A0A6S8ZJK7_9STRA|mmetsp:Transcript_13147/g.19123  ORF Transcript_13147/g.19123 Transcript_13147/m.19123 type:complete len:559 (-) Transcript_13147:309-1985(-)
MDFFTLATATSTRNLLRYLEGNDGTAEDDDFTNLYGSSSHTTTTHGDSMNGEESSYAGANMDSTLTGNRPLLSPSAEAELYLLATNFLLYVAMVIITTMIAKIYFPALLERDNSAYQSRSVAYQRVHTSVSDSYYSSDAEDDDDVDEEDDGNFDLNGEENQQKESEGLVMEIERGSIVEKQQKKKKMQRTGSNETGGESPTNLLAFEFDQSTTSRATVLKTLTGCSLMLNLTFVTWGLLQERMLTRRYPRITGEYFTYSYALVFTNRFWTLIMSGLLFFYFKPRWSRSTVIYEYSFPSISNMLSSWCQYEALRYVSFPAVTLFKSFKLAPVMAMGKLLGNKEYPQYDYFVALVIGIGLAMFMSSTEGVNFGYDVYGEEVSATWTGIMLMFLFLFFDSFTSQWQSRMFQRHRDLSMLELMFATSAFSTVLSLITLIHTDELGPALDFVWRHSEIHLHFFMFSVCSTIGQILIFYTIKNFGAVVFTIIMTTRVLLSIALSCMLYGHKVSSTGFLGLMVVLGAVCYRIKKKVEGKHLIKWQGMEDTKAHELVQEWHEHVDT